MVGGSATMSKVGGDSCSFIDRKMAANDPYEYHIRK